MAMTTALRRWRRFSPAEKSLARRRADEAFDELEAWMVERVRGAFRRTFAGVTDRLSHNGAADSITAGNGNRRFTQLSAAAEGFVSPDDLVAIPTAWVNEVQTTLLPAVDELYQTGGLTALVQFGPAVVARQVAEGVDALEDVLERRGLEFLEGSENRLRNIGETAWEDARDGLAEGFRLGESVDEIARRVQKSIEVSLDRAVTIARTETTRAVNAGQLDTVKALAPHGPQFKEWLATSDTRTREWHDDADGDIVLLDAPFIVGGEEVDAPGDGSAANSINCRCTLLYVDEGPDPLLAALEEPVTDIHYFPFPSTVVTPMSVTTTGRLTLTAAEPVAEPEPNEAEVTPAAGRTFETLLTVEGRWTGDERVIMADALNWDGLLPLPLTASHDDHPDAAVGLVTEIERRPGPTEDERLIVGSGIFDDGFEAGAEIVRKVELGTVRGVSVDIDAIVLGGIDPDEKPDDAVTMWREVIEKGRIRALALTSLPAFAEAYITLDVVDVSALPPPPDPDAPTPLPHDEVPEMEPGEEDVVIIGSGTGYRVVAAGPSADAPPFGWFTNPHFEFPAPLTITNDGHVLGHLALWGVCHTGIQGACVYAPRSQNGYAGYLLGEVLCADGSRVPVGKLTVGGGHAEPDLTWRAAVDHYDRSSAAVADVFCGEDEHGIWFAGAVRQTATVAQIAELRASPLSGDWRRMGNRLELVAALGVNVPAFQVPRVRAMVADGRQISLVAAGALDPRRDYSAEGKLAAAERIARTIGRDRHSLVSALICRVHPEEG